MSHIMLTNSSWVITCTSVIRFISLEATKKVYETLL